MNLGLFRVFFLLGAAQIVLAGSSRIQPVLESECKQQIKIFYEEARAAYATLWNIRTTYGIDKLPKRIDAEGQTRPDHVEEIAEWMESLLGELNSIYHSSVRNKANSWQRVESYYEYATNLASGNEIPVARTQIMTAIGNLRPGLVKTLADCASSNQPKPVVS